MMPTSGATPFGPPRRAAAPSTTESSRRRASARVGAEILTCPILRFGTTSALSYQCTEAPGVAYARDMSACAADSPASPSAEP